MKYMRKGPIINELYSCSFESLQKNIYLSHTHLFIHLFQLRLLQRRMMHDAWSMSHSLRCIIVASLVNYVATSLETLIAKAADASADAWGNFLKNWIKKNIALICFIEITSILAHAKAQLNQAVKPYQFDFVKRRYLLFNTQCHCSLSALNHWLQS